MNPNIGKVAHLGGIAVMAKRTKEERIALARHASSFRRRFQKQRPLPERFAERWMPEPFSGCWLWSGDVHVGFGYGMILVGKRSTLAHRVSWELYHGPIPKGLCVLHQCDTPPCVNPDHLFLGTKADNAWDKILKGRHAGKKARKLTLEAAQEIKSSNDSIGALAEKFNVAYDTVWNVRKGISWKILGS